MDNSEFKGFLSNRDRGYPPRASGSSRISAAAAGDNALEGIAE
jgi:hypothetical protein